MTSSPEPAGRIRRLTQAIGEDHAADIDPFDHLITVLTYLDDQAALRTLHASPSGSRVTACEPDTSFEPDP